MKYNEKFKILFEWNPVAQCVIGRYFGWQIVWQIYEESRDYKEGDKVLFTMSSGSQWDKLINILIKEDINGGIYR